jgi:hypothetical protein
MQKTVLSETRLVQGIETYYLTFNITTALSIWISLCALIASSLVIAIAYRQGHGKQARTAGRPDAFSGHLRYNPKRRSFRHLTHIWLYQISLFVTLAVIGGRPRLASGF